MIEHARDLAVDDETRSKGAQGEGPLAAAMREHGAALGRVVMALLGDREAAERALEQVARSAASQPDSGAAPLVRLMGLARTAAAVQVSKIPVRAAKRDAEESPDTVRDGDAAGARASLGRLKPTEREAVVLHLIGGLDAEQVAEACGVSAAEARSRISRGVAALVDHASTPEGER